MAEPNYPAGHNQELIGHDTIRRSAIRSNRGPATTEPYWAIRQRRGAGLLRGRSLNVYNSICSHANREGWAFLGHKRLSSETGIDRRHLSSLIRKIEATGLIIAIPGRGRGHATVYRVIDETSLKVTNDAGLKVAAEGDIPDLNVTNSASEMSPPEGLNVTTGCDPTTMKEPREGRTPPSGESPARARGDDFSDDGVNRRQGTLLLPLSGRANRDRRHLSTLGEATSAHETVTTHSNGACNGSSKEHRLPPDWTPTAADTEQARGWGLDDPDEEAEAFRDYWLAEAGPKAVKRDWNAAYRTWCRHSAERRARDRGGTRLTAAEERCRRAGQALYRAAIAGS